MRIEVEDWIYEELEERRRVLGYNSISELLVDYIIRRAPPIALERQAVKGIHEIVRKIDFDENLPIDYAIGEIAFQAASKYGFLITSIPKLEGTILELLVVKFIEKTKLDLVYRAPQVGYGYVKGRIRDSKLIGLPDISYGIEGRLIGIIEVKKQDHFHITYHDKLKLLYYMRKGFYAHLLTTAPIPQRSTSYNELRRLGVKIHHIVNLKALREAVDEIEREAIMKREY